MNSTDFQSQTAAVLSNLEKKISKYLTLQYESSDIFDKFKAMKKQHEQAIKLNKQFVTQNERQTYKRNQHLIPASQFDKLMYRRKQCEAKLYQMLYDHQNGKEFEGGFSASRISEDDLIMMPSNDHNRTNLSSMKQVKSQKTLSSNKEPNFRTIENQLQNMQLKIQNLQKKINKNSSKKHKNKAHQDKSRIKQTQSRPISERKQKKYKSQQNLDHSKTKCSPKQNSFKRSSPKITQNNQPSYFNRQNSQQIFNRHINYRCQQLVDQTIFKNKVFNNDNKKPETKAGLNESKLKKVGLSKFNDHKTKNNTKEYY